MSIRKLSLSNKCILVVVVVCLPFFDFSDSGLVFILFEFNKRLLIVDLPTPDLVVYLQANTETLFKRIINRGIEMEKNISFEYLESLNECYKDFFLSFERSPVMIVNTESIDLANNISDFQLLVERLLEYFNNPEGRKIYFNPSPSLL